MLRLAAVACALLSISLAARADPPAAEGRIETDEGKVEILGRPYRVGETIRLPEGFLRVEEKGTEDDEVGSFAIVPAEALAFAGAPAPEGGATAGGPAPATGSVRDCRAERSAYLAELWRLSGIEVSSPEALLRGLDAGGSGPGQGFYWFAIATDPFRPLAWSSALRSRAEALARCVRGD